MSDENVVAKVGPISFSGESGLLIFWVITILSFCFPFSALLSVFIFGKTIIALSLLFIKISFALSISGICFALIANTIEYANLLEKTDSTKTVRSKMFNNIQLAMGYFYVLFVVLSLAFMPIAIFVF